VPTEKVAKYAAEDADAAWQLTNRLEIQVASEKLRPLYDELEIPLIEVLAELEYNGIRLDLPALARLSTDMQKQLDSIEKSVHELAGKEFTENAYVEVLYDGTNWILLDIPSTSTTILINQQIASSSSALIFTTGLDDTYDEYLFVMTGLAGQPAGQIGVQISIDAGATWLAAPNYWSAFQHISSHNAAINQVYGNFNGSNALFTISGIYDAVAHHLMDGEFRLFRPGKTGSYKHCIFHTSVVNSQDVNGAVQSVGGGCNVGTLAPINGIRFFSTPGVIPSGTIHMYGVSRS